MKKYDEEFKKKAEELLKTKNRAQVAEKLGCSKNALRRWFGPAPKVEKPAKEKKAAKKAPKKDDKKSAKKTEKKKK